MHFHSFPSNRIAAGIPESQVSCMVGQLITACQESGAKQVRRRDLIPLKWVYISCHISAKYHKTYIRRFKCQILVVFILAKRLFTFCGQKVLCTACTTQQYLSHHIRTNSGENHMPVTTVVSHLPQQRLNYHLRTHTGKKTYDCDHCTKSFTTQQRLSHHIRTHRGEKPFSCYHCGKSLFFSSGISPPLVMPLKGGG